MSSFDDGFNYFVSNTLGITGSLLSDEYVASINKEIDELIKNLNNMQGFQTSSKHLKGDVAEFWHAGTFNINAALKESNNRAYVDRSHEFASPDITTNFGKKYGLKYYNDGIASAKAQSISVYQRFKEYQSNGGLDSLEKFLTDRGYTQIDTILDDPIYKGQIRVIPKDQLEDAVNWLKVMIAKESSRRPEQVERYKETLKLLTDRLKDDNNVESIPIDKKTAEQLAELAKRGEIKASEYGLDVESLMNYEYVLKQAFNAGVTAATISMVLKIVPELYKCVIHLIEVGEVDKEEFKKVGLAAINGASEGFIRGSVSAAITTCCKSGLWGSALKEINPTIIGAVTVITMNVLKNAVLVTANRKSSSELVGELVKDLYLTTFALISGGITQSIIEIPILGYMIGSLMGTVFGTVTYEIGYKHAISFCIDTGFTMFGLVEQDYVLPNSIIQELGIETFEYETFDINSFAFETFQFETFGYETFIPESIEFNFLRRGVIGVNKIGYI